MVVLMDRRTFISSAFVSVAAMALGINFQSRTILGDSDTQTDLIQPYRHLFTVLLPVFLNGALDQSPTLKQQSLNNTFDAISRQIRYLDDKELQQLLTLLNTLNNRLGALLLTAELTPIIQRNPQQLAEMINNWRDSFLTLHQLAYIGLRELIFSSFYSIPKHWQLIGYTKPDFE